MSRVRFGLFVLISTLVFIIAPSYRAQARAQAVDANVVNMAESMRSLLPILDSLGTFDEIASPIPLTDQSLNDALSLATLFTESLDTTLAAGSFDTADDLAVAINGADTTVGGVTIDFSNAVFSADGTLIKG